jgi:hypothetical protein
MTRWIDIRYKCRCLDVEVSFQMRERQPDEEIVVYMEHVQRAIGVDHTNRSPQCTAAAMEYAKVPVVGDTIGGAEGGTA